MQYITDVTELQLHNTAIALGKFDGFHRGHQLLLRQVKEWQEQKGLQGVIFTFGRPLTDDKSETHGVSNPSMISQSIQGKHIDSHPEKLHKAERMGIDVLLEYPFTPAFASKTPEKFIEEILVKQLDVKAVTVGRDFRFGRNRSGDVSILQEYGKQYGFEVVIFDKLELNQEEISSSSIRDAILRGDMEFVCQAMGRGYSVYGEVIHGKGLGHTIDIPTINQSVSGEKVLPPYGVYAARCHIGQHIVSGIANLGCKPTVSDEMHVGLETHLFDFNQDIYGKMAEVELLKFIRHEQKFDGIDALLEQMRTDIRQVKKYRRGGGDHE